MSETIYTVKTGRIVLREPVVIDRGEVITSPHKLWKVLRQLLEREDASQEHFFVILLNTANQPILWKRLFVGGTNAVTVDPRVILRWALLSGAVSIILAHNHPSGNLVPSREDIAVTKQLREAGRIMDISILDHIVFDGEGYTSLEEQGLI